MLALLPALILAASPEVIVVRRTTVGVSEPTVTVVLRSIVEGLKKEGLSATQSTRPCAAERACLADSAIAAKAAAAVGVTIIRSRRDLTVDLEGVDGARRPLAVQTFSIPFSGSPLPPSGAVFFQHLSAALASRAAEDAPRLTRLEPEPPIEPTPALDAGKPNTLGRVAAVTSLAAGAAAIGLLIAGGVIKGGLDSRLRTGGVVPGARETAQGQASLANAMFTASLVGTVIALAAGTAGVVLWEREPAPEEAD